MGRAYGLAQVLCLHSTYHRGLIGRHFIAAGPDQLRLQGVLVREPDNRWVKSSFSANGACVEVDRQPDVIRVRDSKDPEGAVLSFLPGEWNAFLCGARAGEFDLAHPPETGL